MTWISRWRKSMVPWYPWWSPLISWANGCSSFHSCGLLFDLDYQNVVRPTAMKVMSPADTYHWGYWGDDLYAVQFFRPQTLLVLAYLDSRMLEHAQAPFQKRKKQKRNIIIVVVIIIIIIRRILEQYPLPTQAQEPSSCGMVHLLEPPESCRFHLHHTRVIAHDLAMTWPMVSHGIPWCRSW